MVEGKETDKRVGGDWKVGCMSQVKDHEEGCRLSEFERLMFMLLGLLTTQAEYEVLFVDSTFICTLGSRRS